VNIRKFIVRATHLDELVGLGTLTPAAAAFLEAATVSGLNIIVAGGTQAGKTMLLNCLAGDLDGLKARLADPVADRIVESLRVAREVGGCDLGRLLRTLSAFLREDARTRSELETRQGWTVNAARLASAAPWIVLAMLATRPEAVEAYDSATGFVVLAVGGAVCFVAYRLMLRIGRLPEEERVLR
jgi:hypothetical protein